MAKKSSYDNPGSEGLSTNLGFTAIKTSLSEELGKRKPKKQTMIKPKSKIIKPKGRVKPFKFKGKKIYG